MCKKSYSDLEKKVKVIRNPNFFTRSADEVASDLLGMFICREFEDGTVLHWCITETEAYDDSEDVTYKNNMFYGTREWCPYNGMLMINCYTDNGCDNVLIRAVDCIKGPCKVAEALKINEIKSEIIKKDVIDHDKLWLDDFGFTVEKNAPKKRVGIVKKDGNTESIKEKNYQATALHFPFFD